MQVSTHCVWPVKRPRWVVCVRHGVVIVAMAALLYCLPLSSVAAIALLLVLFERLGQRRARVASTGTLWCVGQGRWTFAHASRLQQEEQQQEQQQAQQQYQDLRLVRAWLGVGWVTMHFSGRTGPEFKDTMLQVTIWKAAIAPDAWRRLRVQMSRCIARPEPASAQVSL